MRKDKKNWCLLRKGVQMNVGPAEVTSRKEEKVCMNCVLSEFI